MVDPGVEWRVSPNVVSYEDALTQMEERIHAIAKGQASEMVWLLEHPPLYTAGTSSKGSDLLDAGTFPVYQTGRGGQYTYHGPGQRIAYVMIDVAKRGRDVKAFVHALEKWIIDTLGEFGIQGERRQKRIGIWVQHQGIDQKIAALGIRLRQWISFHGIAINVSPDLSHYQGIVPCGLPDYGVTSCEALGINISLKDLDQALQNQWVLNRYLCKD